MTANILIVNTEIVKFENVTSNLMLERKEIKDN